MNINIKKLGLMSTLFLLFFSTVIFVSASTDEASAYLAQICKNNPKTLHAVLCSFSNRISALETTNTSVGKVILDLEQVRGSLWETTSNTYVPTTNTVTVNCTENCSLWVNFDVDTRNTHTPSSALENFHLFSIFIDGNDQAVFNQVTATTANAAYPLAINGVFPVSAGNHTVTVYAKTTAGTMQNHESHLQVMAIAQ